MSEKMFFGSLTRISDLRDNEFGVTQFSRDQWATGDYVVVRVDGTPRGFRHVELDCGRLAEVSRGDDIVGALGDRHATLEAVGSWRDVESDASMDLLTSAGLAGKCTSISAAIPPLIALRYRGHCTRGGRKVVMDDFVPSGDTTAYTAPTILIVGTSMSAGKTTTGKLLVRELKRQGLRVVATKLTGAGRYRDTLAMQDTGADAIFDFVDVGMPSTVLPQEEYRRRLRLLLRKIQDAQPDVVVAEAGASPLEPYNGDTLLEELGDHVAFTVLCASDPYAVVGIVQAMGRSPDLVAGLATSTTAGIELVDKLTGLPALNPLDPSTRDTIAAMLTSALA